MPADDPFGQLDDDLTEGGRSRPLSETEIDARRRGRIAVFLTTVLVMLTVIVLGGAWVVGRWPFT